MPGGPVPALAFLRISGVSLETGKSGWPSDELQRSPFPQWEGPQATVCSSSSGHALLCPSYLVPAPNTRQFSLSYCGSPYLQLNLPILNCVPPHPAGSERQLKQFGEGHESLIKLSLLLTGDQTFADVVGPCSHLM